MPVTDITTDRENLTMTLTADVEATSARLWDVFTQPRQLERVWGPPGWPATFVSFDFAVGGRARYHMTGPNGEIARGGWEFISIDEARGFEVLDEFVGDDGEALADTPSMRLTFDFEDTDAGARFTTTSYFPSVEALEQILAMGAAEGMTLAMGQLDTVVKSLREFGQGKGTETELLNDNQVRITRLIDGPRELVWRAHTEPDLMQKWLLGPEGWAMTVCEIDPRTGGKYRYAWEPLAVGEGEAFGFDGEILLSEPVRRMVTTEHMTGTDYPSTTNDMLLIEEDGATLITLLISYSSKEARDAVLATGMTSGMEDSYARLERITAA
ncbi:uncharacterized protein YndB with AHSA1/START domain [Microbacterium endophyticum]|uniref:Uncharacterized protein YndB with AHSA1/START domain n=1 Tax=Microbacterium endophyticum TaxID=1526412 RepID=A0A7W4V5F5_9MICO|nr:SRPBCC family protein [Microbacterium endophyticum]MBB2977181.1 uncharacterized protein YndB with AHSA1/START domain [Microbacterium endophyticum]NIK36035.1 uncharacterized protein YndB with AHSA1/START domain [Microbacterium endophyticum]